MNFTQKPKSPFWLFIGCALIGMVVFIVLTGILMAPQLMKGSDNIADISRKTLLSIQIVQMISLFIIPPVLYAIMSKNDFINMYNLDKKINYKKYAYATLFAICLYPILINLQYIITQLPFSAALRLKAEQQNLDIENMTKLFLGTTDLINSICMILMMGLGAGLTEELFFRGTLMPLLAKVSNSKVSAIIVTSFLFAFIHMSIYNFIPILIVGSLFGFIYFKTMDLKLNIFIHSIYNGFQLILYYLFQHKIISMNTDEIDCYPLYLVLPCVAGVYFMTKLIIKNENIYN